MSLRSPAARRRPGSAGRPRPDGTQPVGRHRGARGGAPVYGVNTGFGALADTPVSEADLTALQAAIIRSHAAAVGEPLGDDVVRALLLLRARTLTAGYSGVRADLPRRLLDLLAEGLLPVIPGKGSVGASGDLAQLAHLAQPLIGEGLLREPGGPPEGRPAADVLAAHGLEPLSLAPKEGLSLVNGTEPMQAVLAFSVHDAAMLVQAADVACALSIEALLGTDRPYDERVQALRPHPGQLDSAANLRALLAGRRCWPATGTAGTRCRTPTACAAPRRCTGPSGMCSPMPGGCWRPSWAPWSTTRSSPTTARS